MMIETDSAGALFRAGRLADAILAANAAVRGRPGDLGARLLLAELLVFAGNLERADVILDAAAVADPSAAVVVAEFRQLLRAEMARRQWHRDGRLPEFLGEPTPSQRALLAAGVARRVGDAAEAARAVAEAEALRPHVAGQAEETPFDDLRDADDLAGGTLEVLTTTGKYFWVPLERMLEMAFHPPARPRDLIWRRATVAVADGPDGEVYIPALYWPDAPDLPEALRLGRETDWVEQDGLVRGRGQRCFLIGDVAFGIMQLTTLRFGA
ncbi:MAG TPA: type VI secretion system accessory protein TagJ [Acetobacteraceae bacterium]|nr:type VI secretion system accessory protein TagJ [Acetobacteraceae bacterium]